jgi:ketosteroid isomerase-like protein
MRKYFYLLVIPILFLSSVQAQSKKQIAVANVVEQLKKAMINADSTVLDNVTAAALSYGHSSGHIDTKSNFIEKIISGKSDFVSIELTEQTITVSKNIAVVRHQLHAVTSDSGKPGEVNLFVLLIWQHNNSGWKLLARQAVKQMPK